MKTMQPWYLAITLLIVAVAAAAVGYLVVGGEGSADATSASLQDYEAAIQEHLECVEASGIATPVVIPGEGLRPTRFYFESRPVTGGESEKEEVREGLEAAVRPCAQIHLDQVRNAYRQEHLPPEPSMVDEALDQIEACMERGDLPAEPRSAGFIISGEDITGSDGRQVDIVLADVVLYTECALDAEAQTGVPVPVPNITDRPSPDARD